VAGDSATLYLLAPDTVVELGRRDLDTIHRYRLPFDPMYVLSDTPHRRAFVGAERGSDIAILDCEAGTLVASMKTGRSGVKVGKGLLSALSMAASPVVYWPGATATGAVPSADGKRLFVANVQTNDVTVIDLGEAKVLEMLRVGTQPYFMSTSTATSLMWVFSSEHVTRIDTGTLQQVDVDLTDKEGLTGWPHFDASSRRIIVPRETGLEILSATDGSPAGSVGGMSHPVQISRVPRLEVALPDPAPAEALPPAE
jgi:YVTN family beta-propeller protein